MDEAEVKRTVREAYSVIVKTQSGCGCTSCGSDSTAFAKSIGYSEHQLGRDTRGGESGLKLRQSEQPGRS